jgi:hypothetical protein
MDLITVVIKLALNASVEAMMNCVLYNNYRDARFMPMVGTYEL